MLWTCSDEHLFLEKFTKYFISFREQTLIKFCDPSFLSIRKDQSWLTTKISMALSEMRLTSLLCSETSPFILINLKSHRARLGRLSKVTEKLNQYEK